MDLVIGDDGDARCSWGTSTPDYAAYHDDEWGAGVTDDHRLFEKLCLEGFQSGLSWLTILRKRDNFRTAFAGFDPAVVAGFDDQPCGCHDGQEASADGAADVQRLHLVPAPRPGPATMSLDAVDLAKGTSQ